MFLQAGRLGKSLLAVGAIWASQSANAASARLEGAVLIVNEMRVLTLRAGDPAARSRQALSALRRFADRPIARATGRGARAQLYLGGTLLYRIGARDASASQSTPIALAKAWAANLNQALALPPIAVGQKAVSLGNGRVQEVSLLGRLAGKAAIESSDETVVTVRRGGSGFLLTGVMAGSAQVVVSAGSVLQTIQVQVRPVAARFPQNLSAAVTGVPSTSSIATGAVEAAIWTQLKTMPLADLKFSVPEIGQIPLGEARTVAVRVRATAPEALSNEGQVYVTVRNTPRVVDPESELWYCNHPETLEKVGPLFAGNLAADRPVRMLYHHVNEAGRGLVFHAQILNPSDREAKVLIIPGDAPTDRNPVFAGIVAAERFLRNWLFSSGEVVTVPPMGSLPIAMRRMAPHDTVSGLLYVDLLDGGPPGLLIRADAKLPFSAEGKWAAALNSDSPWRLVGAQPIRSGEAELPVLSDHVYPEPFREMAVTYQVGGRHGFVRIGQVPLPNSSGEKYLDGNFGVIYKIHARIENPTSIPAEVEVVFEASAGYSGALFALNGQVMRTPLLQPKDERRILSLRLEPGATRQFTMHTLPLSGGSYPATLAIRPLESTQRALSAPKDKQ